MELSRAEQLALVRSYVQDNFVDAGMCADFALHDKGDGNPHAHIMLTIRPLKPDGRWGPKCRKVYDLDSQGKRIPDGKGGWRNHREDTTNWNNRENAEKWRAAWAAYANRALEAAGRPERIDHRKVAAMNKDYYDLRGKIVKAERRLTVLDEWLEMWAQYEKYKPIRQKLDKVKSGKREKYQQEHRSELAAFDVAADYLKRLKEFFEKVHEIRYEIRHEMETEHEN